MNKIIICILALLYSSFTLAQEPPAPVTPIGEPFNPPTAQLPITCQGVLSLFLCDSNAEFEFALEQEFWGHIGNGNHKDLIDWNIRAKYYLFQVKQIDDVIKARIETFIAFSHVAMYVQNSIFNPFNLVNVIQAIGYSTSAMRLDPNSPNLQSLFFYLNTYVNYATFARKTGQINLNNLQHITDQYGPVIGSEGEIVGAMARMLLVDDHRVVEGLKILNECETIACRRNSSTAPYKEVGMQIAIAEGHARLGNFTEMEHAFEKARNYAKQHNHPYPELIDDMYNQLTRNNGIIEQWQTSTARLGDIRLPLPPSAGATACQTCHASGFQTINHYKQSK